MNKTIHKLHTFDQMANWAKANPNVCPNDYFYDYSEQKFVSKLQNEINLLTKLETSYPKYFKKDNLLKRIANAMRVIIGA